MASTRLAFPKIINALITASKRIKGASLVSRSIYAGSGGGWLRDALARISAASSGGFYMWPLSDGMRDPRASVLRK
jgi:hypothetical protein